ncbi:MAG: glycoside hydrolase family 3 C-terminal domain-containing protein, partial [Prevotellaceae bacterium]|nr:glycoside hydrolase family 3 C-terminal domain-containing protein [Prevotellaceae bacterium]
MILKSILTTLFSIIFTTLFAQPDVERKINDLISRMTLEEKIGQMNQLSFGGGDVEKNFLQPLREGKIGSLLNVENAEMLNKLQKVALEESRLGIPLIIGRDVIHGYKTILPIPLGQAATFDTEIVAAGASVAAHESRSVGITWTFAPMLDISRDPRWGRIAESLGEDPYLDGTLGAAMVRGFQTSIAACIKHFVGYGAAEGGRDYNSTNIPPALMRNVYLPPFEMAAKAGALTVMTSFNDNDGMPSSANSWLLKDVLRGDWKFDGFVVSDWGSMDEMLAHGNAKDDKHVAELSANAGLDMEMVSRTYIRYLSELVNEGKVSMETIDNAVRNILRVKFRLGLFENPYAPAKSDFYSDESLKIARRAAVESAILLKNDNNVLPLKENVKIALIGPMADAPHDQLGTWSFDGEKSRTVTPLKALQTEYTNVEYVYEAGLAYSRDLDTKDFEKAKEVAAGADVAIVVVGEEAILSGEAHSLSNINLIGKQSELLAAVKSAGKPVIMVVMAGRPLTIERDLPNADAVLYCFHPGTMGGAALFDLVFGKENPSGKLPVTMLREVGQVPLYYNHNNTGRPAPANPTTLEHIPLQAGQTSLGNTSYYLDSGRDPLFPFGYGLSYSMFEYSDLVLSANQMPKTGALKVSFTLKNTGKYKGTEVAQLYIRDLVGSIARPVKELKGYQRVTLDAGASKTVEFTLNADDLAFYGSDLQRKVEAGDFT